MRNSSHGFTLIELMIVVAILGILAAIAIPQYQRFLAKTRRVEGVNILNGLFVGQMASVATFDLIAAGSFQTASHVLGIDFGTPKYYDIVTPSRIIALTPGCDCYLSILLGNIDGDMQLDQLIFYHDAPCCSAHFGYPSNQIFVLFDDIIH